MVERVSVSALNSGILLSKLLTRMPCYSLPKETIQNGRFSGRLREVIAYENRTAEGLFWEEVSTNLNFGREFIEGKFLSYYDMLSSILSRKVLVILWVALFMQRTKRSNHASRGRLQEVKNNGKIIRPSDQKVVKDERWSLTRDSNWKTFTGEISVFWIGGHL